MPQLCSLDIMFRLSRIHGKTPLKVILVVNIPFGLKCNCVRCKKAMYIVDVYYIGIEYNLPYMLNVTALFRHVLLTRNVSEEKK